MRIQGWVGRGGGTKVGRWVGGGVSPGGGWVGMAGV